MGDTVVTRSVLRGRVVTGTAVVDDGVVEVRGATLGDVGPPSAWQAALAPGLCADLVALTDNWRVDRVMRGGAWSG
jgi:hypothetical protein